MKASDKVKIWNIINELIMGYDARILIEYGELTLVHPWFKNASSHISLKMGDPLKTFQEALNYLEDQKQP